MRRLKVKLDDILAMFVGSAIDLLKLRLLDVVACLFKKGLLHDSIMHDYSDFRFIVIHDMNLHKVSSLPSSLNIHLSFQHTVTKKSYRYYKHTETLAIGNRSQS